MVATNQPGDLVFEKVENAIGDFSANYVTNTSGVSLTRAVIADPSNYDPATNPPDYQFIFSAPNNLRVEDGLGAVVYPTAPYTPGQTVAFNGIEVQFNGNPLPGDVVEITPEQNISVFDTVKAAIDWMEVGTSPADPVQHEVDYQAILTQLDSALNHITSRRTEAGIRLQLSENQKNNHLDAELNLSSGRSNIEDLDFAKAIADFDQSKVALQAAQQTFVQIKNLNLFNYI